MEKSTIEPWLEMLVSQGAMIAAARTTTGETNDDSLYFTIYHIIRRDSTII